MKSVWTKVGAVALAGVVLANVFMPCAFATETVDSSTEDIATVGAAQPDEFFSVASETLDFGRISELGRSYTKTIVVNNNTANDVIIDSSVSVYDGVGEDNQKLAEWIAFVGGIAHFNIATGASREISVRIVMPEEAVAGTQYANVDLVDANGHKETVLVKVDIAGDNLKYSSEVVDAMIEPVRLDNILSGKVTVKNTGTAGFVSTYQIRAKNFFGGMDWKVIKETSEEIFPDKQFEFTVNEALGFGVYSVEQRVTFVNEEGRMVESLLSRTVINLPWWSLAIAGGVILLIILIVVFVKCRKSHRDNDKIKRAERKARKAEIARVERAEKKALKKDGKMTDDVDDDNGLDAIEEFSAEERDDTTEIEQITKRLEADDDSDEDEEPVKVTVKKK